MDLRDEGVPFDDPGIEAEVALIVTALCIPEGDESIESVDGLAFGIGAVDLDVSECPFGLFALLLEGGAELGLCAAQRQRTEHGFGSGECLGGPPQLFLDVSATGE